MPLVSLQLRNFKCFADSGRIQIAPLTVIFGRNNAGKSSILQSLLLLRQTLDSPEEPRLKLKGPLYSAGSFADLVHQHKLKERIILSFGLTSGMEERHKATGEVELEFCNAEPQAPPLVRLAIKGGPAPLEIHRTRGRGGPFGLFIDNRSLGGEEAAHFFFRAASFLPFIAWRLTTGKLTRPTSRDEDSRHFAHNLLTTFRELLGNLKSVGAFRHQPDRRYEYEGRLPEAVDLVGEKVVNALIEDGTRRRGRGELLPSVNRWLKEIGHVRIQPIRRISKAARIFEIRLKDLASGQWANLADVGFGIGQAFPVIVEGIRTQQGGTFLVQEPEIHLHPDAQLAMADFLVDLVRNGRNVIVETHSEHLLLRIRRSVIASGSNGHRRLDASKVCIIYVEKDAQGVSTARRLTVDQLGQVSNWPRGFMEQATEERMAIMEAAAQRAESPR